MHGLILHVIYLLHINSIHLHTLPIQGCIYNFLLHRIDLGVLLPAIGEHEEQALEALTCRCVLFGKYTTWKNYLTYENGKISHKNSVFQVFFKIKSNRWSTLQRGKYQWGLVATSFIQISTLHRPVSSPLLITCLWRSNVYYHSALLFLCILLLWRNTSSYPWFCQL